MLRCLTPHCSSLPPTQRHQMDREAVVFLIDASPAMLQRAPGVTTNAVNTGDGESSKSQVQIKTYLDVAIDCARGLLRDRVVAAPSDKQGVVFFNTKHTRGLDDHVGGLSGRDHVFVSHRMAVPSARRIQDLSDLLGDKGETRFREKIGVIDDAMDNQSTENPPSSSYYETLIKSHHVCREMLNDHPGSQRVAKRVLLFTNRDDPVGNISNGNDDSAPVLTQTTNGFELLLQWREFQNVHKIDIRLFALPMTDSSNNSTKTFDGLNGFYRNLTTCCLDEDEDDIEADKNTQEKNTSNALVLAGHELVSCDGSGGNTGKNGVTHPKSLNGSTQDALMTTPPTPFGLDLVTKQFKRLARRVRKVRGSFLQFGNSEGEKISVDLYAPFARAKKPKSVKVHCRDLSEVHCETVFVSTSIGAYVAPEEITKKCIDLGGGRVVVTPNELADAKRAVSADGIHVYGFREHTEELRENLLRWTTTNRPARLMRPSGDDSGQRTRGNYRGANSSNAVTSSTFKKTNSANGISAFTALVDVMRAKNRVGVGVVARTSTRDASVRGCVLVPAEDANGNLIGLHVVTVPFLDDIRHPEKNHDRRVMAEATAAACGDPMACDYNNAFDAVVGSRAATETQIASAERVIDVMALCNYDPCDVSNPALSRHYRALECQALGTFFIP